MFVEFLGVRGVGKSTLVQGALQQAEFSDWQSQWVCEIEQAEPIARVCATPDSTYLSLLADKKEWIKDQGFQQERAKEYSNYINRIIALDQFLRRRTGGKPVLADELFLQNFSMPVLLLARKSPELIRPLLMRRNIVFVVGFLKQIVANLRKREAEGAHHAFRPEGEDDYLMQHTADFQNHLAKVVDAASELGSNCLTIDSNRGIDGCVAEISGFLRGVRRDAVRKS